MSSRLVQAFKTHRASLPWVLAKKVFAKLVRVETLIVYSVDLRGPTRNSAISDPALRFFRVNEAQDEYFSRLCLMHPERNFFARLNREGQQCVIAVHNRNIAGYAWFASKDLFIDEIACTYKVATGEIFIYDCFVEPQYRGAGIYPAMLAFILEDRARNSNLKTASIAAVAVNRASIRGILKAGFVEQRRIRYLECLRKQKWWGLDRGGEASSAYVAK